MIQFLTFIEIFVQKKMKMEVLQYSLVSIHYIYIYILYFVLNESLINVMTSLSIGCFSCCTQTWGQLHSNVIDYITITLQFS